jgi:glycosyltransferase involved in cell wall biosynthesis
VLGCLARIESQKNPLFLVGLLPDLPERVRLVWVGDGRLRGELLDTAERLGVRNRVRVDGWRSDARARLAGFDAFALPSQYEGLPLAVLEAMAAGLPCVASDVDGNREALVHGESGYLCPPAAGTFPWFASAADRGAWLACLHTLIAGESRRREMGQAARRRYLACFNLEAMAHGTVEVYRKVIADQSEVRGRRHVHPIDLHVPRSEVRPPTSDFRPLTSDMEPAQP